MIRERQRIEIKTKLIRQNKHISELAREFGISRTFLSAVINGTRESKRIETMLKEYLWK